MTGNSQRFNNVPLSSSSSVPLPPTTTRMTSTRRSSSSDANDSTAVVPTTSIFRHSTGTMMAAAVDDKNHSPSKKLQIARTRSFVTESSGYSLSSSDSDIADASNAKATTHDGTTSNNNNTSSSFRRTHEAFIHYVHAAVKKGLKAVSGLAVRYPRVCLVTLSTISLTLLVTGLFTNFYLETENYKMWPPRGSMSLEHSEWLYGSSHFNQQPLVMDIIIHKQGDNVVSKEGVEHVFEVMTYFQETEGYKKGCALAELIGDANKVGQCTTESVADFWNETYSIFNSTIQTDDDVIKVLSQKRYPTGVWVDRDRILGNVEVNFDVDLLEEAQSYLLHFGVPWSNVTLDFETLALERMLALQNEWERRGDAFVLEVQSYSSYSDEFMRSVQDDLWLLPLAFGIQSLFTVFFAFGKLHRVQSRGLLGVGAVVTIVASIFTAFGLLFVCGVPFTSQTILVPFVMFGIGLDDAFIIYGSYHRRSHLTSIAERIQSTMEDVGVSIFLTTFTSMLAFVLGSFSSIPAIQWLCLYLFLCIFMDFFYQITFFVALIVLDERRIQQNRMDCCTFITVPPQQQNEEDGVPTATDSDDNLKDAKEPVHPADRLMQWWSKQLLKGGLQVTAMLVFGILTVMSAYWASQLEQNFDSTAMVPVDSYLKPYYNAANDYTSRDGIYAHAYFRNVDQSNSTIQQQMKDYIRDLVRHGDVDEPTYFWLTDFQAYSRKQFQVGNQEFQNMTFDMRMDQFLSEPHYRELYRNDIGRNAEGKVVESRCKIHISVDVSTASTELLPTMRSITKSQPINDNMANEWSFFTYSDEYHLYEYYDNVVQELIFTSIMGVVAVSFIAIVFIPHWTAVLFVVPIISILYINMLGFLYVSGNMINGISFVTLIMSIGLMVDYIMHILMRYYESSGTREQCVTETMSSMGASVFLGAASTFLGVMTLSLSTSEVLQDVFVSVVGLIMFGITTGLVFLPVVLDLIGPQDKEVVIKQPETSQPDTSLNSALEDNGPEASNHCNHDVALAEPNRAGSDVGVYVDGVINTQDQTSSAQQLPPPNDVWV